MTDKTRFEQEIRIMQEMRHPRIVHLYDLLSDANNYYILMEFCPNGELLNHVAARRKLPESEAKMFFKHILDGISFMHSFDIAHRDLKLENVLLDSEGNAKITDFGLAKYVGPTGITSTSCGTPYYAAPEILSGQKYNAKLSDMWSLGVILYAMVTGQLPWTRRNQMQLYQQIRKCHYHIPSYVSVECADLIHKLICLNPENRFNVNQALEHPWLTEVSNDKPVWKEVPVLSLRRLDRFFGKEPSEDCIRLPYRPASFGKKDRNFQKEERLIQKENYHKNPFLDLSLKPNISMRFKPSTSNQGQTRRIVVKKVRKTAKGKSSAAKNAALNPPNDSAPTD